MLSSFGRLSKGPVVGGSDATPNVLSNWRAQSAGPRSRRDGRDLRGVLSAVERRSSINAANFFMRALRSRY